ncbi:MAG TPA: iron-containing alcohol dehydrogenase, partial [Thermoplasmata archaeon]|nr:iron-containing alcohol dehydrogenase [Thermoplasmata archaeon]
PTRPPVRHAGLVSVLLPLALEFDFPASKERLAVAAPLLGGAAGQARGALAQRVRELFRGLGLPATLGDAGVDLDRLAAERGAVVARTQASTALRANPRIPSAEEIGQLLDAAVSGRPVDF